MAITGTHRGHTKESTALGDGVRITGILTGPSNSAAIHHWDTTTQYGTIQVITNPPGSKIVIRIKSWRANVYHARPRKL